MKAITEQFKIEGDYVSQKELKSGHINKTWQVVTTKSSYILQDLNTSIFKDPIALTNNMIAIVEHLKNKGERMATVIMTKDNKPLYVKDGRTYRMFEYIDKTITYDVTPNEQIFSVSGEVMGRFQKALVDFDISKLKETIKDFHNTPKRFKDFTSALEADVKNRRQNCEEEVQYILSQENNISKIQSRLMSKEIPLRVVHNDPKLSNMLFYEDGKDGVIIDLDTVMPGSYLFDFGEAIRFGTATAKEDETDLSKVDFNKNLFIVYAKAYLAQMHKHLNENEIALLTYSAYLMTFENAMRFLTDYLQGDVYFHTARPEHNLDRARTQIKMAKKISALESKLQAEVSAIISKLEK